MSNLHPFHMPRRIRREEAELAGYTPEADYPLPAHLRAPEGTDCLAVFAAQVEHARETNERKWTA